MKKKTFLLFDYFQNNVVIRNRMREFFKKVEKEKAEDIVIDFKNIDFISRSCSDEYLKLKAKSKKFFKETNVKDNVRKMLEQVYKSLIHVVYESNSNKKFIPIKH